MNEKPFLTASFNDTDRYRLSVMLAIIIDLFLFVALLLIPSPWYPALQKAYWPVLNIRLEPETTPIVKNPAPTPAEEPAKPTAWTVDKPTVAAAPTAAPVDSSLPDITSAILKAPSAAKDFALTDSPLPVFPAFALPAPAKVKDAVPVPTTDKNIAVVVALAEDPLPSFLGETVIVASERILPAISPAVTTPLPEPKSAAMELPQTAPKLAAPPPRIDETSLLKELPELAKSTSGPIVSVGSAGEPATGSILAPSSDIPSMIPGVRSAGTAPVGIGSLGDGNQNSGAQGGKSTDGGKPAGPTYVAQPSTPIIIVYPFAARARGAEGNTEVKAVIAADGKLEKADIRLSSGDTDLDAAALAAVKAVRFQPAQRDGQAVKSELIVPFRFQLNDWTTSGGR